jgi:hypothetical protein
VPYLQVVRPGYTVSAAGPQATSYTGEADVLSLTTPRPPARHLQSRQVQVSGSSTEFHRRACVVIAKPPPLLPRVWRRYGDGCAGVVVERSRSAEEPLGSRIQECDWLCAWQKERTKITCNSDTWNVERERANIRPTPWQHISET